MTVKELIQFLLDFPMSAEVYFTTGDYCERVYKDKISEFTLSDDGTTLTLE